MVESMYVGLWIRDDKASTLPRFGMLEITELIHTLGTCRTDPVSGLTA